MKKKVLFALFLALALPLLSACTNNQPHTTEGTTDPAYQTGESVEQSEEIPVNVTELNLVENGKSEYVIVRGENASESEVTASTELQKYLKQISDVELAIITDNTAPTAKEIVVGKTNRENAGEFDREELGNDGFLIKTRGYKLFLVGSEERGTLYSVYEFLEAYLGCRFYTAKVEKVPAMETITIDVIEEDKQIPGFAYRNVYAYEYLNDAEFAAKRRQYDYSSNTAGHSFELFCHPYDYYETHPEYFASDGTKPYEVTLTVGQSSSLCLTNPDVLQLAIDWVRGHLKNNPDWRYIHVGQNDNFKTCMCENCVAVYREEGGAYSGTIIRFINAIARDIKEDYPDVYIGTFAYMYSTEPPLTKAEDNVVVILCQDTGCSSHPIENGCVHTGSAMCSTNLDGSKKPFGEKVIGWNAVCDHLQIWDYDVCFRQYDQTYPNFEILLPNLRFYAENNVERVFAQLGSSCPSGEFGELRAYLLSKLMWDPYMTEEEYYAHMDDFLVGVYGPEGLRLREYIDKAEEISEAYGHCFHWGLTTPYIFVTEINDGTPEDKPLPEDLTLDMILNYQTTDWSPYYFHYYGRLIESELLEVGKEAFAAAYAAAETDSQRNMLEQVSIQLDLLESFYLEKRNEPIPGNIMKLLKAFLKQNADTLTDDEQAAVQGNITKVFQHIKEFLAVEYEAFNRSVIDKAIKYGTRLNESFGYDQIIDCSGNPDVWFDANKPW